MNNPYFYCPQPSSMRAADDVFRTIASNPEWQSLFSQGKMLGVLVYSREPFKYICAYSGVINGLVDPGHFFVPPIYDLQNPDDFYQQKDAEITAINRNIAALMLKQESLSSVTSDSSANKGQTPAMRSIARQITEQKALRKELSTRLQLEIFSHFNFVNHRGEYKNIVAIFSDARHALPPGGSGECAAPRLLQYAFANHLQPLEIAEFWFGASPKATLRIHGQFYSSCIEKCSPILRYMTLGMDCEEVPEAESPLPISQLPLVYEDDYLLVVEKPAGVLSVPGKVEGDSVETYLHSLYPAIKGPMLVHRLDQSTSGLMLAAKDANTHKRLQQDFTTHAIQKEYVACLDGRVMSQRGIISLPICPNPDDRPRQTVDFQFGKPAVTHYEILESFDSKALSKDTESAVNSAAGYTLVRFSPLTGRTHQLRLHAASGFGLGHPITGDRIYGGSHHSRLLLHAQRLTFVHPVTGQTIVLQSSDSAIRHGIQSMLSARQNNK